MPWEAFFDEAVRQAVLPGSSVLDIGAGLRVDGSRGNVVDSTRAWIKPLLEQATYVVMDPVDTYHPDIVADVMDMPSVASASFDTVFCLAVLEHVPRPWDAMREIHRVLKPGGTFVGYVPFLSPYHGMPGYYGDFFRYTDEGVRSICSGFVDVRLVPVRGPVETLVHLLPGTLPRRLLGGLVRRIDGIRRSSGHQVSGYTFTAKKALNNDNTHTNL
ncbi:methyltransferase domain-containing protein [Patescibacteria group bacterium]|nr:methyltransferase domain-containing protein [Patescibacteria group bacterium]MBU1448567.1 methyltransferase domain-containing protein [Patescibacteria group bacterium]MBU2613201.1 methyltransferase domain-containing protein [Patescibacteria group bacterium]